MSTAVDRIHRAIAILIFACIAFCTTAQAEIGATATSEQSTYVRGEINTFVFHVTLFSEVFETADNIHFEFPPDVPISSARIVEGDHTCPDALLLVLGMGSASGGWFNPGYPSGCGFFFVSSTGSLHTFEVDADIPAGFTGPLPVRIYVDGDGCCDPPPHAATVDLNFADSAAPAFWNFDEVLPPALSRGWSTGRAGAGTFWRSIDQVQEGAPIAMFGQAHDQRGEASLTSPRIQVGLSGGEVRFRQRMQTEALYDGGILEISIDQGAYEEIENAGGEFRVGGYTDVISGKGCPSGSDNPLIGARAWSGQRDSFETAVRLPPQAAGHTVQLSWRLGSDCTIAQGTPSGWWIDDVRFVPHDPVASIGPDKLAVRMPIGVRDEALHIANPGAGLLGYSVVVAPNEACEGPVDLPWLHVGAAGGSIVGGNVEGGGSDAVNVEIDSRVIARGTLDAALCVTSTASSDRVAIPVHVETLTGQHCVFDRVFASGFDDDSDGRCGESLRTFTRQDAFLAETAPGYSLEHFTGLRTGPLHGPVEFGNATFTYSVYSQEGAVGGLSLFAGSGVLSTQSAGDQLVITFTGAPVTAVGGNFWPTSFFTNLVAPLTVILELDDGSKEVFTSGGRHDFRGFIASKPIRSLTITTPDIDPQGDIDWGVFDNLIVGRSR